MLLFVCSAAAGACAIVRAPKTHTPSAAEIARYAVIARSQVWMRTNIRAMNLRVGPGGPGAFRPGATVPCRYVDTPLKGKSPKFLCRIGADDEVMVKYGRTNGEVFGEVLATRLLWALGFAADRMYPVTVACRGCPATLGVTRGSSADVRVTPAAIERPMIGREVRVEGESDWSWDELDWADPRIGGAPRAHRDALKLLAVFLQHADNKRSQQRIVCRDARRGASSAACGHPMLMISDLGLTFGHSNWWNENAEGSVNLEDWRRTPIWKGDAGCTGNLAKSFTGTLADPAISEDGRAFLAGLLVQLSDRQIRDLFTTARVTERRWSDDRDTNVGTIDQWVGAFHAKRREIVDRSCLPRPRPVS